MCFFIILFGIVTEDHADPVSRTWVVGLWVHHFTEQAKGVTPLAETGYSMDTAPVHNPAVNEYLVGWDRILNINLLAPKMAA